MSWGSLWRSLDFFYLNTTPFIYSTNAQWQMLYFISILAKELEKHKMCCCVETKELSGKWSHHVIPVDQTDKDVSHFAHTGYWRTNGCWLLTYGDEKVYSEWTEHMVDVKNANKARGRKKGKPANIKAPVSQTDPKKIKFTRPKDKMRTTRERTQ